MLKKGGHSIKRTGTKILEHVMLVILDGWGIAPKSEYNAISLAKTPNFDRIKQEYSSTEICASGKCVGLTEGQMGNSEVGHLTIGAGRVIFQDLMRVNDQLESGKLARYHTLMAALRSCKKKGAVVHFLGLLSDGGVHSHMQHLFGLLAIARQAGISKAYVHVFLDGRDTPPKSGAMFVSKLQQVLDSYGSWGAIASISGRYYAMDRDGRWDRTKQAYDAIVYGRGSKFDRAVDSVEQSYQDDVTDEFVTPRVHNSYSGIRPQDLVIFYNFRPDRARQLTKALSMSSREFGNLFDRTENTRPRRLSLLTMTNYDPKLRNVKALLGRERVANTLSNVLEKHGIKQLKIAETEKYAHVTYFFNGLVEKAKTNEDRILVPSLKVETYDKKPEMRAREICSNAVRAIREQKYGFVLVNFANSDMVGHSGKLEPTTRAVEAVDSCLGEIYDEWKKQRAHNSLLITADHGNAEKLFDEKTGQPHTAHTSNPVPFIVVSTEWKVKRPAEGSAGLVDVAPTVLKILNLRKPPSMTGEPLVTPI